MGNMMTAVSHRDVVDCDEVQRVIAGRSPEVVYVRQLASRIFPLGGDEASVRNSVRRLRRFINGDPELLGRLRQAGYRSRLPYLTQRQLRILCDYV